jgi:hypothetical protein
LFDSTNNLFFFNLPIGINFKQSNFNFFNYSFLYNGNLKNLEFNLNSNFLNLETISTKFINSENLNLYSFFNLQNKNNFFQPDFVKSSRFVKRSQGLILPLRLKKSYDKSNLFVLDMNNYSYSTLKNKPNLQPDYLVLKQKRYTKKLNMTKLSYIENKKKQNYYSYL